MAEQLGTLGSLLSPNTATPQSVNANRLLALALQKEGMSTDPIRSPWQGVGRIAQSIMGGFGQYEEDQKEKAGREDFARAVQSGDLAKVLGSMSNAGVNPEAAKAFVGSLTPELRDMGTYVQPFVRGQPVGQPIYKSEPAKFKAGDVEGPTGQINYGPNGPTIQPLQQPQQPPPGGYPPPVFGKNGMQGNLTSGQGQPPAGTVAQSPAFPTTPQGMMDLSAQSAGNKKAAETNADLKAKDLDSVAKGVLGNAQISAQQKPNIKAALGLVENYPGIALGSGNEAMLPMQRLAASIGANPNAATPRELFNTIAAKILADQFSGMKAMANEAGSESARIFAPMLALEEKANVQAGDSAQGTIAKLKMMDKMGDNMMRWGNMVNDHRAKYGAIDDTFHKQLRNEIAKSTILDFPEKNRSPEDELAHGWARANPNDPRAAKILQHLGVQ